MGWVVEWNGMGGGWDVRKEEMMNQQDERGQDQEMSGLTFALSYFLLYFLFFHFLSPHPDCYTIMVPFLCCCKEESLISSTPDSCVATYSFGERQIRGVRTNWQT
jgi:hypothetical protein